MGYPSETHPQPKSCEISFVQNLCSGDPEHDITTVLLCWKLQNDWTTETDVIDKRDFIDFIDFIDYKGLNGNRQCIIYFMFNVDAIVYPCPKTDAGSAKLC